jgi:hypothetical protein
MEHRTYTIHDVNQKQEGYSKVQLTENAVGASSPRLVCLASASTYESGWARASLLVWGLERPASGRGRLSDINIPVDNEFWQTEVRFGTRMHSLLPVLV